MQESAPAWSENGRNYVFEKREGLLSLNPTRWIWSRKLDTEIHKISITIGDSGLACHSVKLRGQSEFKNSQCLTLQ
jgi:hypothetical protein